jgi:hypothetical protein
MPTLPSITFDPVTRAAQYIEVAVLANSIDPATGANPGVMDTTTPLTMTYLSGAASGSVPAYATIAEVAQAPDGARILRIAPGAVPGAVPGGGTAFSWSIRLSAAGRTGTLTVSGTTPLIPDVSGVAWNGVGPQTVQP